MNVVLINTAFYEDCGHDRKAMTIY